jgi:hypothetical protein
MFSSETLEVGIGMAFVFLLVSLICTGIKEWFEGILKWRAMDLERALRTLLDDNNGRLTMYFFSHPLISSLYPGKYDPTKLTTSSRLLLKGDSDAKHMPLTERRNLPSYIPSDQFAKTLLDIVGRGPGHVDGENVSTGGLSVEDLRQRASSLSSPFLQRIILSAIDHSNGDLKQLTENIQHWYDGAMDRASGWYKRRTQAMLFGLGSVAACALNVDSLYIMEHLTADKTLREVVVTAAAKEVAEGSSASGSNGLLTAKRARAELENIDMPMGWVEDPRHSHCPVQMYKPGDGYCKLYGRKVFPMILGWFITAIAVMLGAPFWFDVLNKFMVIRSTVKPREKSREEDSKDSEDADSPNMQDQDLGQGSDQNAVPKNKGKPDLSKDVALFIPHQWRDGVSNPSEAPL